MLSPLFWSISPVLIALGLVCSPVANGQDVPKKKKSRLAVGKATTFLTEPLDQDGYVNYRKAIDDLYGRGVTSENNANVPLRQMSGDAGFPTERNAQYYDLLGIAAWKEGDRKLFTYDDMKEEFGGEWRREYQRCSCKPWTEEEAPMVAEWIRRNADLLGAIRDAAARPFFFAPLSPYRSSMMNAAVPDTVNAMSALSLLQTDAMLNLGKQREGVAMNDLIACHRLAAHMGRGWALLDQSFSAALRCQIYQAEVSYLNHARPNVERTRFWRRKRDAIPRSKSFAETVGTTARYLTLDCLTRVARPGPAAKDWVWMGWKAGMNPSTDPALARAVASPTLDFNRIAKEINAQVDEYVRLLSDKGPGKRATVCRQLTQRLASYREAQSVMTMAVVQRDEQELEKYIETSLLANLTFMMEDPCKHKLQADALADVMVIGWALSAWYSEHETWPAKLQDLVPKYIDRIPPDRYTGRPLHYRIDGKSCRIYSVGPNLKDDAGDVDSGRLAEPDVGIELRR